MAKRVVKPYRFEAACESDRLTPGEERRLWNLPAKSAPKDLDKWQSASTELDKFYAAPAAAMAAYHLGELERAKEIAQAAIALASHYPDNWNFGNAVHFGHTVLGLVAVRAGDRKLARSELRASGQIRGSPQLNSFGPSMRLARELLKSGEREGVLEYLELCRKFWTMGQRWIDIWERKVTRGAMPTFLMQSSR
jgi:hypothetical protein